MIDDPKIRSTAFQFLSALFQYPSVGQAKLAHDLRRQIPPGPDPDLAETLRRWDELAEEDPESRGSNYIRLFKHVSPYETEYTLRKIMMKTDALADIAGFYRAFGYQMKEGGERPDHLSAELQFLALASLKEAIAAASGDAEHRAICLDAQKVFLQDHLGRWVAAFRDAVKDRTEESYYSLAAEMTAAFVRAMIAGLACVIRDEAVYDSRSTDAVPARSDATNEAALQCPFAPNDQIEGNENEEGVEDAPH